MDGYSLLGVRVRDVNALHLHEVEQARTVCVLGHIAGRPKILIHRILRLDSNSRPDLRPEVQRVDGVFEQ